MIWAATHPETLEFPAEIREVVSDRRWYRRATAPSANLPSVSLVLSPLTFLGWLFCKGGFGRVAFSWRLLWSVDGVRSLLVMSRGWALDSIGSMWIENDSRI